MRLTVDIDTDELLSFSRALPQALPMEILPGAQVLTLSGRFGFVCVQEFEASQYLIRYSVFETRESMLVRFGNRLSGLIAILLIQGDLEIGIINARSIAIRAGQFTMVHGNQPVFNFSCTKGKRYYFLEIILSEIPVIELLSEFRDHSLPLSIHAPVVWVDPPIYMDEETRDHIRYIFGYNGRAAWRTVYFQYQVRHIAWKLLAIHTLGDDQFAVLTDQELNKVTTIQQLIVNNLHKHVTVRELAKTVGISQSGLKKLFARAVGTGIHEYRIRQRLKKATELIHGGKLVKEAAASIGWRSANLIKLYRKIYGDTPGKVRARAAALHRSPAPLSLKTMMVESNKPGNVLNLP